MVTQRCKRMPRIKLDSGDGFHRRLFEAGVLADLDHRVHQGAVRHRLAGHFLRAERLLVELDRLRRSTDHQVWRDRVHAARNRAHAGRGRWPSRGCLLSSPCAFRLSGHKRLPDRGNRGREIRLMLRLRFGSPLTEPEAHQDLIFVGVPDTNAAATDSFLEKAEGLVQATGAGIRREHAQLRLLETANAHPFQDAVHQEPPEADFPPSVADRDADPANVLRLREIPAVAVRRAHDLARGIGDEQDVVNAIERCEPASFRLHILDVVQEDVNRLGADEVRIPHEGLRVPHSGGPNRDGARVPQGDAFCPHRVGHACHSGNRSIISGRRRSPLARYASICSLICGVISAYTSSNRLSIGGGGCRSTSRTVAWIRSSKSARSFASSASDQRPFTSRYFRIRSIGSRFCHASSSSFERYRVGSSLDECGPIRYVTASIIVGPPPARALSTAAFVAAYTASRSFPSTRTPSNPYASAFCASVFAAV